MHRCGCHIPPALLDLKQEIAVWHRNYGTPDATLLLPFTLGWTLLFGILLSHTMVKVRRRDGAAAKQLFRNDILCTLCICFLPTALREIPGNWEIFLAQMLMVPPLVQNWNRLRRIYNVPAPPSKRKKK